MFERDFPSSAAEVCVKDHLHTTRDALAGENTYVRGVEIAFPGSFSTVGT